MNQVKYYRISYFVLIFNKDTQIVLFIGLRIAQADSLAVFMVSTYKFEIPRETLPRLPSLLKKRI